MRTTLMKVIPVILVLLLILLAVSLLAPWLGADRSDGRSETARPESGWFPPLLPQRHAHH